jgi:hypothetical protein
MPKKYRGSPLFHMRMPQPLYDWFRGYSKRVEKPMSAILKDYLQELRCLDAHDVPQQPLVADYLRGQIPRKRFIASVGEDTFQQLWQQLAEKLSQIRQSTKRERAADESPALPPDSENALAVQGVANSFLLWNLPDSYGTAPLERVQVVEGNIWVFPIVLTSPGLGIVGEVGHIAVDSSRLQVVGCTPRAQVTEHGKKFGEKYKAEIEVAFLRARRA